VAGLVVVAAVAMAAVTGVARAHAVITAMVAATAVAVGTVAIARPAKTAAANSSPHARMALALRKVRAVAVDPVLANQRALPANPAHHARQPVNPIPCAPASI
jgi:hypothetical protein